MRRLIFACNKVYRRVDSDMSRSLFLNSQPHSGAILPKFKACTFIYIPSMCMWAVKALAIFRGRAGSSEPSLSAYATGSIIS